MTTAPTSDTPAITIEISVDTDGYTYQLTPQSRLRIRRAFPDVEPASRIFVGHDTLADFEDVHGSVKRQVIALLTGVSAERLRGLGAIQFRDPVKARSYPFNAHDQP